MIFNNADFAKILGKRLQEYRQQKKFTLDEIIKEAHLSIARSSLSAIENGTQDISAQDLYALSMVLDFSLDKLTDEIRNEILSGKYSINLDR